MGSLQNTPSLGPQLADQDQRWPFAKKAASQVSLTCTLSVSLFPEREGSAR